ncbi:hypothetical protein Ciccas_001273 [Cichlidogyrus casuarinus]|uniref:Hexosyltransferase n=1 Tax=Cichlidogyrus casuarinus TaxID=1844966 RepID=A0ABD2QKK1_9PLAT
MKKIFAIVLCFLLVNAPFASAGDNATLTSLLKPEFSPLICAPDVELLILVKSAVANRILRETLRSFWFNETLWKPLRVKLVFVLGISSDIALQLETTYETASYKDIIQGRFIDSYRNNTLKMMFSFNLAKNFCKSANFVLFLDDDYCLNPAALLKELSELRKLPSKRFILGHIWSCSKPARDPHSKWYIEEAVFSSEYYPEYPGAGAFIVPRSLINPIYSEMLRTPIIFMDDVFLGLVMRKLIIYPLKTNLIHSGPIYALNSSLLPQYIAFHGCRHFMQHQAFRHSISNQ